MESLAFQFPKIFYTFIHLEGSNLFFASLFIFCSTWAILYFLEEILSEMVTFSSTTKENLKMSPFILATAACLGMVLFQSSSMGIANKPEKLTAGQCYKRELTPSLQRVISDYDIKIKESNNEIQSFNRVLVNMEKVKNKISKEDYETNIQKINLKLSNSEKNLNEYKQSKDDAERKTTLFVILESQSDTNVYFNNTSKEVGANLTLSKLFDESIASKIECPDDLKKIALDYNDSQKISSK